MLRCCGRCLEEGVAEDAVGATGPVQALDPLRHRILFRHRAAYRLLPYALDHGGEGVFYEAIDEVGFAGVDVGHPRGYRAVLEARLDQEGVQLPPDESVAPAPRLQLDQRVYRLLRMAALRAEVGRAVVAIYQSNRAAPLQDPLQRPQGGGGGREVLEGEADEDMVEVPVWELQVEDVADLELDVADAA